MRGGFEYVHFHSMEPPLHVIVKRMRLSPDKTQPFAYYYMARGNVFQAPDLASVLSFRLVRQGFERENHILITLHPPAHHHALLAGGGAMRCG